MSVFFTSCVQTFLSRFTLGFFSRCASRFFQRFFNVFFTPCADFGYVAVPCRSGWLGWQAIFSISSKIKNPTNCSSTKTTSQPSPRPLIRLPILSCPLLYWIWMLPHRGHRLSPRPPRSHPCCTAHFKRGGR